MPVTYERSVSRSSTATCLRFASRARISATARRASQPRTTDCASTTRGSCAETRAVTSSRAHASRDAVSRCRRSVVSFSDTMRRCSGTAPSSSAALDSTETILSSPGIVQSARVEFCIAARGSSETRRSRFGFWRRALLGDESRFNLTFCRKYTLPPLSNWHAASVASSANASSHLCVR
jgi:hypothetical protein